MPIRPLNPLPPGPSCERSVLPPTTTPEAPRAARGRRAFLAAACLIAGQRAHARSTTRPEPIRGDWALQVDGDPVLRMLSIDATVASPGGLRFEAAVHADGRRDARPASGSVRDDPSGPTLGIALPGAGRIVMRRVGEEAWQGSLHPSSGPARPARLVRLAPDEPASLLVARETALPPGTRVRVLYFGADDCVYCRAWEGSTNPEGAFLDSDAAKRVELVKVKRARTVQPPGIDALPEDLQSRVPSEPRLASFLRAAPGWLVVVDDRVLLSRTGLGAWSREVAPFVSVLARRLEAH